MRSWAGQPVLLPCSRTGVRRRRNPGKDAFLDRDSLYDWDAVGLCVRRTIRDAGSAYEAPPRPTLAIRPTGTHAPRRHRIPRGLALPPVARSL